MEVFCYRRIDLDKAPAGADIFYIPEMNVILYYGWNSIAGDKNSYTCDKKALAEARWVRWNPKNSECKKKGIIIKNVKKLEYDPEKLEELVRAAKLKEAANEKLISGMEELYEKVK